MPDDQLHPSSAEPPLHEASHRLESWKAIAQYLGRHPTTVQRWEQEEGLPVHRHHHEKRGSVYAFAHELDAWLAARSLPAPTDDERPQPTAVMPPAEVLAAAQAHGQWKYAAIGAVCVAALVLAFVGVFGESSRTAGVVPPDMTSVAVLPLTNRSPDQQPDYFVDGMTEALVTDLASLKAVRVIARQSMMQYRNSGKPASRIANELGADALIEGSVQRVGSRVRVDIRLIDGPTARSLWATSYEREAGDALALQSDISRAIVRELHLTQAAATGERFAARPANADAWDAYLKARFFWNRRTHDDMSRAIEWYERAIGHDPAFPLAYAGLADVYASIGPPNLPIAQLIARGTAAAEKAIALDPAMGEPWAALGKLRAYAWDWQGAESNYRKAIERAPGYAPARYWFGLFLANQRRCPEALAQAAEAEQLEPVSLPGNMVVANIELRCGLPGKVINRARMIVEFDPSFGQVYEFLGRAYVLESDLGRAVPTLERAVTLTRARPTVRASLASAYAAAGRTREAESIATDLVRRHERDKALASAWSIALVHAALGRDEAALSWLEHAYDDREEWLEALAIDERFRRLHPDARFRKLLHRLGLPNEGAQLMTRR